MKTGHPVVNHILVAEMPIRIWRNGDMYSAVASPPEVRVPWQTAEPLPARVLVDQLIDLGAHSTDVGDAFYACDPFWVNREDVDEPG